MTCRANFFMLNTVYESNECQPGLSDLRRHAYSCYVQRENYFHSSTDLSSFIDHFDFGYAKDNDSPQGTSTTLCSKITALMILSFSQRALTASLVQNMTHCNLAQRSVQNQEMNSFFTCHIIHNRASRRRPGAITTYI